ncbi:acyltransferase [bacterium]|nr:acyltransferase [bacterium]
MNLIDRLGYLFNSLFIRIVSLGRVKVSLKARPSIRARYVIHKGGNIVIGPHSYVHFGCVLSTHGGDIRIGSNSSVNCCSVLYGLGGLYIGNDVRIGANAIFVPANHNFDLVDIPICKQGLSSSGIVIDNDCWIGARVTILDGVKVGGGTVVGANSLVTNSLPGRSVCYGSPCKFRRSRYL